MKKLTNEKIIKSGKSYQNYCSFYLFFGLICFIIGSFILFLNITIVGLFLIFVGLFSLGIGLGFLILVSTYRIIYEIRKQNGTNRKRIKTSSRKTKQKKKSKKTTK